MRAYLRGYLIDSGRGSAMDSMDTEWVPSKVLRSPLWLSMLRLVRVQLTLLMVLWWTRAPGAYGVQRIDEHIRLVGRGTISFLRADLFGRQTSFVYISLFIRVCFGCEFVILLFYPMLFTVRIFFLFASTCAIK